MERDYNMFIDGIWVESSSGKRIEVINPANGDIVATVPEGNKEDASKAIDSGYDAFPGWSKIPAIRRGHILKETARHIRENLNEIAKYLTLEQGKSLNEAKGEIEAVASVFEFYSGESIRILGEVYPATKPDQRCITIKQPLGVVVVIAPWNYPVLLLGQKIAPALASGCTVIAKPSSVTPLACIEMIKCCIKAGIPKGVLNIVTGPGQVLAEELIRNPRVSKISFTGETSTGKKIMSLAANSIKKVSLELGGHSPLIVLDDADIGLAVKDGVYRSFRNMGQICNSINRIFVDKKIFDEYVDEFVKRARMLKIGDGLKTPDVDLGPMTTEKGRDKAIEHVRDAVAQGARILLGGKIPQGEDYKNGFFYEPTVLVNVNLNMKVMQEETFGPVAPIMGFDTIESAIKMANNTRFGLVAYLYTKGMKKAFEAAEALEYGTVGINNVVGAEIPHPYGGWKESGVGIELSHHGIDEFLQLKHIRISL